LEGDALKSLGMNQNRLKDAARKFMAERASGQEALSEIEMLKKQIAELKAGAVPIEETSPEQIDAMVAEADAALAAMSDAEIKDAIAVLNDGKRPQGNPSRATLESALREL